MKGTSSSHKEVLSFAIERALEGERVQHKAEMDEVLARTIESERAHKIQMDEMMVAQSKIMSRFSQMGSM